MSGRGRPLRFLAVVGIGWVAARAAMHLPLTPAALPPAEAASPGMPQAMVAPLAPPVEPPRPRAGLPPIPPVRRLGIAAFPGSAQPRPPAAFASPAPADAPPRAFPGLTPFVRSAPTQVSLPPMEDRWSASLWLVARPGSGAGAVPGGQLGGGQTGVRLSYLLDRRRRIGAFARTIAPLSGPGKEAALGVEWQPMRAPVRLIAEQRFGLDGAPGGTGLGLVAGVDTRLPAGFRLQAYGQGGAIARNRIEPYADGSARLTRKLASIGGAELALGGGAWGGAQRDAARIDVGPSATLSVPVGGKALRLSLDWRQRVAGDARPGSGLALTLGTDF